MSERNTALQELGDRISSPNGRVIASSSIQIRGARENNLKNLSLDLKKNKITCITGPSGCGKSSLAFHTLYAESKRRFLNSFPSYLKFFSDRPQAADVDQIFPILPTFGLPQVNPVMGARSAVSDVMGLTELWQGLFFTYGVPYCPHHFESLEYHQFSDVLHDEAVELLAPKSKDTLHVFLRKHQFLQLFPDRPFPTRSFRPDRGIARFNEDDEFWEVVRFREGSKSSLERYAKDLSLHQLQGLSHTIVVQKKDAPGTELPSIEFFFSGRWQCPHGDFTLERLPQSPQAFSPYNALGACSHCSGHGANLTYDWKLMLDPDQSLEKHRGKLLRTKKFARYYKPLLEEMKKRNFPTDEPVNDLPDSFFQLFWKGGGKFPGANALIERMEAKRYKPSTRIFLRSIQVEQQCSICHGSRISPEASGFALEGKEYSYLLQGLSLCLVDEAYDSFERLTQYYGGKKSSNKHLLELLEACQQRLKLAQEMGLGHLQLNRKTKTLSSGEYQRLLLLKYLGHEGTDCLFIFDEPSVGLGKEEKKSLLRGLQMIRDQGNTIVLVDHCNYFQQHCDELVVMGPGPGSRGGQLCFQGPPLSFVKQSQKEKTAGALVHKSKKKKPSERKWITVRNANIFDYEYPEFRIPLNEMTSVIGPSGSGKTSCLVRTLADHIHYELTSEHLVRPFGQASVSGHAPVREVVLIDANLNRRTGRSSVGSLTELAGAVRKHFLKLPVAKQMQLKEGHLSTNSKLGMCTHCDGKGKLVIEMQFLEDVELPCEHCDGFGLRTEFASLSDGNLTVRQAFEQPLEKVLPSIELTPKFERIANALSGLNLSYLSLARSLNTLSGGERQRLLLLARLLRPVSNALFVFENLSFGLAESDFFHVMQFLQSELGQNNTLVFLDQNPLIQQFATNSLQFDKFGRILE